MDENMDENMNLNATNFKRNLDKVVKTNNV